MENSSERSKDLDSIIDALKSLNTEIIFGKEIEKGNKIVIPVGQVKGGFGYGYGGGKSEKPESDGSGDEGYGGGLGFGMNVEPVGFIEITEESTKLVKINHASLKQILIGSAIGLGMYKIIESKKKKSIIESVFPFL